ncbi:DUF4188 domain-containing protein [Domibacillus robiginosus]|uniref:DUF4188 domain-containing protein n=1 Tax=Domibacillus robiginosus TaxID=1071054 RepID=UPI00067C1E98|nr:DUF4188 domain-containing protein [Domibacillus robiginosus]
MSKHIYPGRYTTENTEDLVVFIIGMRINKPAAINKWLPVFNAMPGMIRELYTNKDDLGFLSAENYFGLKTTLMIQYWRSMDDLLAYAKNEKHLTAWGNFHKKVGNNPAVGIYHETYQVKSGNYESLYGNMPHFGLGKALKHIPVTAERNSAQKRLTSYKAK